MVSKIKFTTPALNLHLPKETIKKPDLSNSQTASPENIPVSLSPLSKHDKLLCINTSIDIALTVGLNAILASSSMDPSTKKTAAMFAYLAMQAGKIWKQSLVSEILPSKTNRAIRWLVGPVGAAAAIGLSHLTKNRAFEIPLSLISTYFIGKDALSKMQKGDPSWKIFVHLFNAGGASISSLNTLGAISLVNANSWQKAFADPEDSSCPSGDYVACFLDADKKREAANREAHRVLREALDAQENSRREQLLQSDRCPALNGSPTNQTEQIGEGFFPSAGGSSRFYIDKLREENQARIKAGIEIMAELDKSYERFLRNYEEIIRLLGGRIGSQSLCQTLDPKDFQDLDSFSRLTNAKLNPQCPEHAKILMTPQGTVFDTALFEEQGCKYIKPKYRRISLLTAVDKNMDRQKEATAASINLNVARKTLCNP